MPICLSNSSTSYCRNLSSTTKTKKFLPLLQQINGKYNGAKTTPTIFKNGGIIKPQTQQSMNIDYDLLASKIAEANKYLPSPKVAITEINTAQTNYTKVEQKANF